MGETQKLANEKRLFEKGFPIVHTRKCPVVQQQQQQRQKWQHKKQQQTGQTSAVLADVGRRILGHLSQVQAQGEGEARNQRERTEPAATGGKVDGGRAPMGCVCCTVSLSLRRLSRSLFGRCQVHPEKPRHSNILIYIFIYKKTTSSRKYLPF